MNYNLIDSGNGRRLESWAGFLVDRPAPQANWAKNKKCQEWGRVDFYFDKEKNECETRGNVPDEWYFDFGEIKAKLSLSAGGQVGVFPEQLKNWQWIDERLSRIKKPTKILNLFAYTGMSTLVASAVGDNTEVWHIDSGKSFVNWARENADLSGLGENKIHWVVEDAVKFLEREVRRGRQYDGVIFDPPAFGRAGKNIWKIGKDLPKLIGLVERVLTGDPDLICCSWHDPALSFEDVNQMFSRRVQAGGGRFQELELTIPASKGSDLPAGKCLRL
jgi:23S rRNA (cytosine1962-C5)-methyltransferase